MCGADFRSAETFLAYDWNEIGTSLEFTMNFFYYILLYNDSIEKYTDSKEHLNFYDSGVFLYLK